MATTAVAASIKRPRFLARGGNQRSTFFLVGVVIFGLMGSGYLLSGNLLNNFRNQFTSSKQTLDSTTSSNSNAVTSSNSEVAHDIQNAQQSPPKRRDLFTLVEDEAQSLVGKGVKSSAAHCSLSTMNEKAWEGAMCSFKCMCYHPTEKQFIFHRAIDEIPPPPHELNLGKGTKFAPKVINGKLPLPRYEASLDETWVLMELNSDSYSKLEDFLRDDLFAWWLLAQHATWTSKTVLRPLQLREEKELSPEMLAWYQAMPFARLTYERDLGEYKHPICFAKAVVGLGSMTDHCAAPDHDYHEIIKPQMGVGVEAIPCPTGRGPLFYRLREEMIFRLSGVTPENQPKKKPHGEAHVVLFAEGSATSSVFEKLEQEMKKQYQGKTEVQIKRVCTACLLPREQLELALTVSVLVTKNTGPQTLIAHLLRRGAGVVLSEDEPYKHTNFGIWNNLAYIRARWVKKDKGVIEAIKIELDKCANFM